MTTSGARGWRFTARLAALAAAGWWLGCAWAAESSSSAPGDGASGDQLLLLRRHLAEWVARLDDCPQWYGPLIMLVALIPLLYGWRLIRWTMALTTAAVVGALVLTFAMPAFAPALAWTAAVSAAIIAGFLGWFLYQALIALQGAALGGGALFMLMCELVPGSPTLALVLAALGMALGFVLGWRVAPYLGIAESVIYGYILILDGMIILCRAEPDARLGMLALIVAVVTIIPGVVVQLRDHWRQE